MQRVLDQMSRVESIKVWPVNPGGETHGDTVGTGNEGATQDPEMVSRLKSDLRRGRGAYKELDALPSSQLKVSHKQFFHIVNTEHHCTTNLSSTAVCTAFLPLLPLSLHP
jgi:hypothetical protein